MKKILLICLLVMPLFSQTVYDGVKDVTVKGKFLLDKKTNQPINGIGKLYYKTGEVKNVTLFKNGLSDGLGKIYYKDGTLSSELPYKDGLANGVEKIYDRNSIVRKEIPYLMGKKDGIEKVYYKTGKIQRETPYRNNKKNGIEKAYYETGKLGYEVTIKDGNAVEGTAYKKDGTKTKMTSDDFRQLGLKY